MKIDRHYEIDRAASDDLERPNLCLLEVDAKKQTITAGDGKIMARVPIEIDKGDKSLSLLPKAIKHARAEQKEALIEVKIASGQAVVGGSMQIALPGYQAELPVDVFPKYRPGKEDTLTIAFDAALLLRLAKSLGAHGVEGSFPVQLTFPKKYQDSPIVVTVPRSKKALGVFAPIAVSMFYQQVETKEPEAEEEE